MADFTRAGIPQYYLGLSTDTKPTGVEVGSRCYETDTGTEYTTADGTNWTQYAPNIYLGDDKRLVLGADGDLVVAHRAATLNANTGITSVIVGTPVSQALAANSLMISNVTASGDIAFYANLGGNSQQWLFYDTSASTCYLSPGGVVALTLVNTGGTPSMTSAGALTVSSGDLTVAGTGQIYHSGSGFFLAGYASAAYEFRSWYTAAAGGIAFFWRTKDAAGVADITRLEMNGMAAQGAAGITSYETITMPGANVGVSCNLKRFYQEITLATDNAETDVGLTPNAVIMSAAIRVSVEIAGLDSADHHIQLGINGTSSKYIDVAQGGAATTISVNKKGKYTFDPTTDTEAAALKLTITGGGDNIPSAGKVYVEVIYLDSTNLADV